MTENRLVRDWMSTNLITIPKGTSLPDAQKIMSRHHIRHLLVVDGDSLVGIITRGDVRGADSSEATSLNKWELNYLLNKLSVARVMTRDIYTINADTTIVEAATLMLDKKIGCLPVLEDEKLIGIITESDIFRMIVETWTSQPVAQL